VSQILDDFRTDLSRLTKILRLAEALSNLVPTFTLIEGLPDSDLKTKLQEFQEVSRASHAEMSILNGVLLLYLAGRFENFVRQIFEDLADSVASEHDSFSHLPKKMRESLIHFTADVMQNARKYGHAENGVAAFVTVLSENLTGSLSSGVNSKCLSITQENMRPDILNDLFARIGATKLWERLGQQAQVQRHFEQDNADRASNDAKTKLNDFMELRNKIAHPSGEMIWPGIDEAQGYIDFFEVLGSAIDGICQVWATTLGQDAS